MQRQSSYRPLRPQPVPRRGWLWLAVLGAVVFLVLAIGLVVLALVLLPVLQPRPSGPAESAWVPPLEGQVVRYRTEEPVAAPPPGPAQEPPQAAGAPAQADSSQPLTPGEGQGAQPAVPVPPTEPAAQAVVEEPSPTPVPPPPTETPVPEPTPTKKRPSPSAAAATGFAYGIQVNPASPPEEVAQHLRTLGIRWVKFQMSWKETEHQPGVYNWAEWDRILLAYHQAGFYVLMSVAKAPDWARPANTDLSQEGPPADPNTFARFLGEMAQRYKGGVHAIEVWNEQNLAREGGGAPMPADAYVAMLAAAYRAIKTADPSIVVVSGAPTPAGDVPGAAIDDISYLNAMYAAGLKNVSDAIGAHPSGYNCPADADWQTVTNPTAGFRGPFDNRHHSWCFRGTMEGYRNVMVANGDSRKLIWPTEFGWAVANPPPPSYEYAADNTREQQAQWIVSAFQQAQAWGWVGPMFLWNLNYAITNPGSEQAAFSILTPEGPTPAYLALAALPK